MSGRRLGRLFGSLLVLSVLVSGALGVDLGTVVGGFQTADIIWN